MYERPPILMEIKSLSNMVKRKFDSIVVNNDIKSSSLTGMQGIIIGYLGRNKDRDVFQKDVESEFNIRRSTATGILQLMERNEWIERCPVSYDARLKKIMLTQKALEHDENCLKHIRKLNELAESGLSDEEKEMFYSIAAKIKKNLE